MSDPTTGSNEEERAPETPGGEARPVGAVYDIGENVSYWSTTHGVWISGRVLGYNTLGGVLQSYDLDVRLEALRCRIIPGGLLGVGHSPLPPGSLVAALEESGRPEVELVEATVVPEAATQHLAELSMEDPDALAALSGPESDESLAEVGDQFDGLSLASTQAPGIPPRIGHGRWAPRAPRLFPRPCPCRCEFAPNHHLGPRSLYARRCCCPMCGHRSVETGEGCHNRVEVPRGFSGLIICSRCADFCMSFLRWGDILYDRTGGLASLQLRQ